MKKRRKWGRRAVQLLLSEAERAATLAALARPCTDRDSGPQLRFDPDLEATLLREAYRERDLRRARLRRLFAECVVEGDSIERRPMGRAKEAKPN